MSTATDAASDIKLPKFLVTTVAPKSQDGDKVVFDRYSKQTGELPLFLVDVKYEDKATIAAKWDQIVEATPEDKGTKYEDKGTEVKRFVDEGDGDFSGTAVSQVLVTSSSHSPQPEFQPWPHTSRSWPLTFCGTNFNLSGGVHRGAGQ